MATAPGGVAVWDAGNATELARLVDPGQKAIALLAFTGQHLMALGDDLTVITWEVASKRVVRRAALQASSILSTMEFAAADLDSSRSHLVVAAMRIAVERRVGASRRWTPVLLTHAIASGTSDSPVDIGNPTPTALAISPGGCFAFYASDERRAPRLHVRALKATGSEVFQQALPERVVSLVLDPDARRLAVGFASGRIRLWKLSGATADDCAASTRQPLAPQGPSITLSRETDPLVHGPALGRLAVLRFETTGVDATLGAAVAEMIAGQLANNPQLTVVERGAIDAIVKEMAIQRSGLTADDAVRIGRGLNARTVMFGSIRRFGDSVFVITARAVDVETQQVLGAREVTCESCTEQDLPKTVAALQRSITP